MLPGSGEIAQVDKELAVREWELEWGSSDPWKSPRMGKKKHLWTWSPRLISLAIGVSSRFSKRPCLKSISYWLRTYQKSTSSFHVYKVLLLRVCACVYTHEHTHIEREWEKGCEREAKIHSHNAQGPTSLRPIYLIIKAKEKNWCSWHVPWHFLTFLGDNSVYSTHPP